MNKVRFGVIGLGDFGERHVQALKAIQIADVVAVCSRTESRAREVATRYGVKKWYTSREKIVKDPEIDAVTIATADDDHVEPTILAAEVGKHVLLEKPIATKLEDADKIIDVSTKYGIIFMVGHILRFDKRYRMIYEMNKAGKLGKIASLYAKRTVPRRAASVFLNRVSPVVQTGIHDIDIMLWILGKKAVSVYAEAVKHSDYKYPDIFWTMIRFEDEAVGVVENGFYISNLFPHFIDSCFEVISNNSTIHIQTPGEFFTVYHDVDGIMKPDITYWPKMNGYAEGALKDELEYFASCVANGVQPTIIQPHEAREALRVALAAEESATIRKPVDIA